MPDERCIEHESRLTKVETCIESMDKKLEDVKGVLSDKIGEVKEHVNTDMQSIKTDIRGMRDDIKILGRNSHNIDIDTKVTKSRLGDYVSIISPIITMLAGYLIARI